MKHTCAIFLASILSVILFPSTAFAVETINISSWDVEIQDDGTCALGKVYEFGKSDAVIVSVTSYGRISLIADKGFRGVINIDGSRYIKPTNTINDSMYMYSNNESENNGTLFVNAFKSGNVATIQMNNGDNRDLSLKGFTRAYNRYLKCAR